MINTEFCQQSLNPYYFSYITSQEFVLCLSTRPWHRVLFACTPRNKVGAKKHCKTFFRSPIIWISCSDSIRKCTDQCRLKLHKFHFKRNSKYRKILFIVVRWRIVGACKSWQTLLTQRYICPIQSVILQGSNYTHVSSSIGINKGFSFRNIRFFKCRKRGGNNFTTTHTSILNIIFLRWRNTIQCFFNFNPRK
jgi:hypothetical protein